MIRATSWRTPILGSVFLLLSFNCCWAVLTADFEDLGLPYDSFYNGTDGTGGFTSGSVIFSNYYHAPWFTAFGCFASSVNDTNTPGFGNQYAVFSGTGLGGTGTYAVVNDDGFFGSDVVHFPHRASPKGIYINNTTYAARDMMTGSAFSKKFGGDSGDDPDWFKLTISGEDAMGTSLGDVDFYLADYRSETNADDYIVSDWTWVDLSAITGDVRSLHFKLDSSDSAFGFINTPAYFAMENLSFCYRFSKSSDDLDAPDAGVPGFIAPGAIGDPNADSNEVNRAFASWASSVYAYAPAPGVSGDWTNTSRALGPVQGDHLDAVSLGDLTGGQIESNVPPGSLTLGFDTKISNEYGPDFAVFENALIDVATQDLFGELGYVEVSSDGTNFARFPSICQVTNPIWSFGSFDPSLVFNLAGKHANGNNKSWGTPFDLADLEGHPLVATGLVDLATICFVRVVDIPGTGDFYDGFSTSNRIYDPSPTVVSGGIDIEAVGVINSPDYQRVTVSSCGPGSITPYGIPAGLVSIETGGGETFSVTPDPGFFVIDVTTNGASMGRTNSVSLQNITSDIAIKARFGSMLTVSSEYGSPEPPTGVSYHWGNTQLQVPDSPVSVGGTQLVCLGWVGSGSVPTNGVGPDTGSVNISNDSTIAWQWKTNYWLKLDAGYGGQVITADGWHASGSNVTVQAQADPFFTFAGWSGASVVDSNAVVTTVSMGKAVCLQANFQAELSPMGVPEGWFASQGLTNGPPSEVETNDVDGDGLEAWEEFFAGTVEGDAGSVFEVIDLGQRDGSNFVKWLAGTNGSALPFCLQGSTNLAVGWYVLGEVPRSVEGTNCWWVPVDGGVTSEFYRVLIKTGL